MFIYMDMDIYMNMDTETLTDGYRDMELNLDMDMNTYKDMGMNMVKDMDMITYMDTEWTRTPGKDFRKHLGQDSFSVILMTDIAYRKKICIICSNINSV